MACVFSRLMRLDEAMGALRKASEKGSKDGPCVRRDPDLAPLHGMPDFEPLFPEIPAGTPDRA